jgi:hypothetical protein
MCVSYALLCVAPQVNRGVYVKFGQHVTQLEHLLPCAPPHWRARVASLRVKRGAAGRHSGVRACAGAHAEGGAAVVLDGGAANAFGGTWRCDARAHERMVHSMRKCLPPRQTWTTCTARLHGCPSHPHHSLRCAAFARRRSTAGGAVRLT